MNVNFDNATFVGYSFGSGNYLISQDEADPMLGTAGNDIIVGVYRFRPDIRRNRQ